MNIIKKAKQLYDDIKIPEDLNYVVNRAIIQKRAKRKKKIIINVVSSVCATSFILFVVLININTTFASSIENIPIINNIAKIFTIKEYVEQNEQTIIDAKIPAIENTGNSDLEQRINYEIMLKMNQIKEEAEERGKEYQKAVIETGGNIEEYNPISINIDYEIKYNDGKIISFVINKTETLANAYTEQYFYNIDIESGKELNLKDLLGKDYKTIVDNEIREQITQRMNEDENNYYFSEDEGGFSGIEDEYHDFYINKNKKIEVVFQKYEIAPGCMGIQEFEISNTILQ